MSLTYSPSSQETHKDNFSCPILDLLDFKISLRNSQDSAHHDNDANSYIPSESVYYAAEYLRLHNEIDLWKSKAKMFELENIKLQLKIVEQNEKEVKLTSENVEVYNNLKGKLDKVKRNNMKLNKALKGSRVQNNKNKELCRKHKLTIKKLNSEINELKMEKLEKEKRYHKEHLNLSNTQNTVRKSWEKCNNLSKLCTTSSHQSCAKNNKLDGTSNLVQLDDGDRNSADQSIMDKHVTTTEGYQTSPIGNTARSLSSRFQLSQKTFPSCSSKNGNPDFGCSLNSQSNNHTEMNSEKNSSQEVVHKSFDSAVSSVDSETGRTYQITSSLITPEELLHFDMDDLFQET